MENGVSTPQNDLMAVLGEMTDSFTSARGAIQNLLQKKNTDATALSTGDGISLLSLKYYLMISYLQSLTLLSSRRTLAESLMERSPPIKPFSDPQRDERGDAAGDLVDSMIEGRVVLEKIKVLEGRMKYQIEKLVKAAEQKDIPADDPLAFRPNLSNFAEGDVSASEEDEEEEKQDGIYRPPRLAPVPYTEVTSKKEKRARREAVPQALVNMVHHDPTMPHIETTTGLGSMPSLASKRARELREMNEFEETNFTRLVMGKKEAKRRARDEADVALGGGGGTGGRRRSGAGGFEDEFGDVLRSVDRGGKVGDGYEELRRKGKKGNVLERSRLVRERPEPSGTSLDEPKRKKTRFDEARKRIRSKKA